jgi:hypothetical protein
MIAAALNHPLLVLHWLILQLYLLIISPLQTAAFRSKQVRGVTKKGKEFFRFSSTLTEAIAHLRGMIAA